MLLASLTYISFRIPRFLAPEILAEWGKFKQFSLGLLITLGVSGLIALCLDFINALVCVMYFAMIWILCDFVFWIIAKLQGQNFAHYYAGWSALIITLAVLATGWYLDHKVWQTDYQLTTQKNVPDLKIAMFADSHIGTTFGAEGFAQHIQKIQAQNPDVVFIVGDYVDDGTTREQMIKSTQALGTLQAKYGIYFVFGNHDKGYYGAAHRGFSAAELVEELNKNGVNVLMDETVLLNDSFYVIGRRDFSEVREQRGRRASMEELTTPLDKNKYMIVLDHQPTDFARQAEAEVDLVVNGHTHGGQLFPFNQVGKWIKANDLVYGYEKRRNTNFIVTSGLSDWAIKFKTGTKSEFVIINIKSDKK